MPTPQTPRTCARCNTTQPATKFRAWMSKKEALGRGYSGERRINYTSNLCQTCRAALKRKPTNTTIKHIQNRIGSGDLHPLVGKAWIAKRRDNAKAKQAQAIAKAWRKADRATYKPALDSLRKELLWTQGQINYRYPKTPTAPPDQLYAHFLLPYRVLLQRIKAHINGIINATPDPNKPTHRIPHAQFADWEDYATEDQRTLVQTLWNNLPEEERRKVRHTPALISWRAAEQRRAPPARPTRPAKKKLVDKVSTS